MICFICCGNESLKLGNCFCYLIMTSSKNQKHLTNFKKWQEKHDIQDFWNALSVMFLEKQKKKFLIVFLFCFLTKESLILSALKQKILD